jgi:transcriptional regulator GlxA family with amidase domain
VKSREEHLSRIFRKVTGQIVFDYLRTVRLKTAKIFLIDSSQSLNKTAALAGFSLLSLLGRNFSPLQGHQRKFGKRVSHGHFG